MLNFSIISSVILTAGQGKCCCGAKVQLIAHRGASFYAPENTLAAINLAWKMGADAVEVDIHLTGDGRIMVCHDGDTGRTASGNNLVIRDTPSDELRKLDVGRYQGEEFTGERIPFLEEVIATVPEGKQLFIEIKCKPEVIPPLKELLQKCGKMDQMVIIGFEYESVKAAKQVMPQVPVYWLTFTPRDKETNEYPAADPAMIDQALAGGLDGVDTHFGGVTPEFAKSVQDAGLGLYIWTVNDPTEARRLCSLGVDGITSDKPDLLKLAAASESAVSL